MISHRFALALVAIVLAPASMLAHSPGAEIAGLVDGFRHPLLGWDHLLAMLALGAWAARQRGAARFTPALAFLAAMAAGGALGARGVTLPLAELAIGVSVLAFGALAGSRARLTASAAAALAGAFGIAHGFAHGTELPSGASLVSFGLGMLAATALLQGVGWLLARVAGALLASGVATAGAAAAEPAARAAEQTGAAGAAALGVEEIIVTGRGDSLVGAAESASQGTVGAEQIELRPLLRVGEVLETVPGVIVTQHAGGGKANQYFLRGFNLDHGTDFATSVDGVPVNFPTHGHGQGYTDVNLVIPELVERVSYRKGVYFADAGDFSSAGAVDLQLVDSLESALVQIEGGRFGHGRGIAATSFELAGGELLGGLEIAHDDGPWQRGDDYLRETAMLRFTRGDEARGFSVTALGHHGEWDSSDQIARSALSVVGRFGTLDDTTGGESQRYQLSAEWHAANDDSATSLMAYAFHYDLDLFSNFTYFAADPLRGDQFEQVDERWTFGAKAKHSLVARLAGRDVKASFGLELRNDDISNGLFNTQRRVRVDKIDRDGQLLPATVRRDDVLEGSVGVWGESEIAWSEHFRSIVGLRADWFRFDVEDRRGLNSGKRDDAIVSPKLTLVLGPWNETELYVQGGLGFHSNDARGVNARIDPVSGAPLRRADPLVRTEGAELGVRSALVPGLHSTLSAWWLDIDSELVFIGDAGTTEAGRPSRRYGIELANYWDVNDWLALDADVSWSHTRFRDAAPEGDHVPGSIETVVAAGLTLKDWHGFFGSVRLRYFGPRPLLGDDSVRSDPTLLLGAQLGYRFAERYTLTLDVFNLLNRNDSDIDYFYESAISPSAPLREERHFHPVEPISARVTFGAAF
ncbi:MAG TPA: TonB-dependent receptor [Myxococcota bacterium]|nr:TonB-dependent receptor [Myxococcota bacterium]